MYENFIFSISKVLPLFIVMFIGFLAKKKNLITETGKLEMNKVVFNIALPVMLFRSVALSDFTQNFNIKVILTILFALSSIYFVSWILGRIIIKEKWRVGGFVQGSFRSNYTIIGLVLVSSVTGLEGESIAAATMPIIIPIMNILEIIVLTINGNENNKFNIDAFKNIIINIFKNPLIRGVVIGIPFSLLSINIPEVALNSINMLANIGSPLALFAIGTTINFDKLKDTFRLSMLTSFLRLVLCPIIGATIAILFNLDGLSTLVICMLTGAPTAVSTYVVCERMGSDSDLVASSIIISTLISVFTFTIIVYIGKTLMWV